MSDEDKAAMMEKVCVADTAILQRLADTIREDIKGGYGLNADALSSIADIIERAIGAPIDMPTRSLGADAAQARYPGSPHMRLAFNFGVRWALENAASSQPILYRS